MYISLDVACVRTIQRRLPFPLSPFPLPNLVSEPCNMMVAFRWPSELRTGATQLGNSYSFSTAVISPQNHVNFSLICRGSITHTVLKYSHPHDKNQQGRERHDANFWPYPLRLKTCLSFLL